MKNVYEYFIETAEHDPDKAAVSTEGKTVTFRQLAETSRRYGRMLSELLCGQTGQPVGVFANRDTETITGFLSVVYAGNFYVPLDPDMPGKKLRQILDDSGFSVILGTGENLEKVGELEFSGTFFQLDPADNGADESPAGDENESALWKRIGGDDPLYMIYTSGSTGRPKGVLKSHGAMISFIETYCRTFDFSEEDILANQTPFFFDASAKDLYLTLKLGIPMEIVPVRLFTTPPLLLQFLKERRVTFLSWVPTALSVLAMLDQESLESLETIRKIFFIGEVMPVKYLNKLRRALGQARFVNLYGQSEIAGACCYYEVEKEFDKTAVLPMGRPMPNCRIWLMDQQGAVIDRPGVIGEIFLVSDALALEYYHDPEKTAACFLSRDFGEGPVRCFRTGDLAQYDEDGNLIFAARNDHQIKHMGHRIELGEIETIAGALPEIARCACLYQTERGKIILFVQLSSGTELTGRDVILLLKEKLVKYMMPAKVQILEKLPLNPNGKIDRQELKNLL